MYGRRPRLPVSLADRRGILRTAVAVAALVAIAVVAAELRRSDHAMLGRADRPPPLLAVSAGREGDTLVRLDPRSLRPLPRSLHLDQPVRAGVWGPSRTRAAIVTGRAPALRLLDPRRMRTLATVRLGAPGALASISWPRRDRIWLVFAARSSRARGLTTVVVVDAVRWRAIARRWLAARSARIAQTPNGPLLLLAPPSAIGPAEVAMIDVQGRVVRLRLGDVPAGTQSTDGVLHVRRPGLAVDGESAFVVSVRSEIIEIDLERFRARRHRLSAPSSLLDRLRDLVDPPAEALPPLISRERTAAWLGPGLIAVSGRDADLLRRPNGALEQGARPAGIRIVDTRRWQARTLDEDADAVHVAGGLLVVASRAGLSAYRPDGRRALHVLDDEQVEIVATAGSFAYVRAGSRMHVVDLHLGAVIAAPATPPRLLPAGSDAPWD